MGWLILLLCVPMIAAPVVVLFGFSGCDFEPPTLAGAPAAPTNLRVTGKDLDRIELAWDYVDTPLVPVTFRVSRTKAGETTPAPALVPSPANATSLVDSGLEEDMVYSYQVQAVRTSDESASALVPDPPLTAATLAYRTAFEAVLTSNDGGNEGFCTVQRIEPPRLLRGGTLPPGHNRVRLTLRGATSGDVTVDKATISQAAATGDDYDSGPDLKEVVSSSLTVPAGGAHVLGPVGYQLDKAKPLLIAFDISSLPNQGNIRFVGMVPSNEARMFSRSGTAEAVVNDRTSGYDTRARIHIVEKIEVVAEVELPQ